MKKQCVRCGVHIQDGLRCKKCRSKVDLDLGGITDKPFEYYFRWWIKKKKSLANLYSNNKQNDNLYSL